MRCLTAMLALFCCTAALPAAARGVERDAQTRGAVEAGLTWLAARWDPNAPHAEADPRGLKGMRTVTPALAGLAFLAAGASPADDDTPNGRALRHCLNLSLHTQHETGLFADAAGNGSMYAHAFTTYFLAHALAKTRDASLAEPLERAVRVIERAQNAEGGWRYRPEPHDADASVTSVQLLALRAARRAGVAVDQAVVDRGVAFLKAFQNADGGFRYIGAAGGSGAPRSAAALVALHAWGKADPRDHARGLDYVATSVAATRAELGAGQNCEHFFYRAFYLAHAFWPAGGEYRDKHLPPCQQDLLLSQKKDGSWDGDVNPEYATAMALIALQLPDGRLLPEPAPSNAVGAEAPPPRPSPTRRGTAGE